MFQNLHKDFVISLRCSKYLLVDHQVYLQIAPSHHHPHCHGNTCALFYSFSFSIVSEIDIKHPPILLLLPQSSSASEQLTGQIRKSSPVDAICLHSHGPPPTDTAETRPRAGTIHSSSPTGKLMLIARSRPHFSRATLLSQGPEFPTLIGSQTQWSLRIR